MIIKNLFEYLAKIQNKYNINLWFCKPSTEDSRSMTVSNSKIKPLDKCSNFVKGRTNVRKVVWNEHCALIKNIEVFLERANVKHIKYWFCDNSTYWFNSQHKSETHDCCIQIKPKIICPK